ncbi:MAG TPA: 50S ribosomal protein L1 [Candidatus Dormibacteraeota bacterium]|nr:50S ribosomal protein L1 [Candidatus Dormibacteraeota bacterium]
MAKQDKSEKKQELEAEAFEREEVLDLESGSEDIDASALPTPKDTTDVTGEHILRNEDEDEKIEEEQAEDKPGKEPKKPAAKAGKRSAKSVREADDEADRKENIETEPKPAVKKPEHKPNPKNRHGKNYLAVSELIDKTKQYDLSEAVELAKKTSKVKFDATVELHVNLGVDPKQADQMVRASVVLPAGTGKQARVAVLATANKHAEAKKAEADIISDGDLLEQIEKGKLDFDVLIATPDMMPKLGKVAKVLGPRNLMPNPKSGTVTTNIESAVLQAKAGKIEFRVDKQSIVHAPVGKVSFKEEDLLANIKEVVNGILKAKPSSTKGSYIKAISLTTSMGPGIKLDAQKAIADSNPRNT